jgi:hypothetical protein
MRQVRTCRAGYPRSGRPSADLADRDEDSEREADAEVCQVHTCGVGYPRGEAPSADLADRHEDTERGTDAEVCQVQTCGVGHPAEAVSVRTSATAMGIRSVIPTPWGARFPPGAGAISSVTAAA